MVGASCLCLDQSARRELLAGGGELPVLFLLPSLLWHIVKSLRWGQVPWRMLRSLCVGGGMSLAVFPPVLADHMWEEGPAPPSHPPQHFWLRSISYIYLSLVFINERWSPSVHEVFWSDELGKFLLILDEVFLSPSSREPLLECLSYAEHTGGARSRVSDPLGARWQVGVSYSVWALRSKLRSCLWSCIHSGCWAVSPVLGGWPVLRGGTVKGCVSVQLHLMPSLESLDEKHVLTSTGTWQLVAKVAYWEGIHTAG